MGHPLGRQLPPSFHLFAEEHTDDPRVWDRARGGVGGSGCRVLGSLGCGEWSHGVVGLFEEFGRIGILSEAMQYNAGSRSVGERRPPGLYWDVWGGLPRTDTAWLCLYRLCLV